MSYADAKRRQEQQQEGGEYDRAPQPMPCRWCQASTPLDVLCQLGARCAPCYSRYLRASEPIHEWAKPLPNEAKTVAPKAWAEALRKREQSGERLTKAQRNMWRAARLGAAHEQP